MPETKLTPLSDSLKFGMICEIISVGNKIGWESQARRGYADWLSRQVVLPELVVPDCYEPGSGFGRVILQRPERERGGIVRLRHPDAARARWESRKPDLFKAEIGRVAFGAVTTHNMEVRLFEVNEFDISTELTGADYDSFTSHIRIIENTLQRHA